MKREVIKRCAPLIGVAIAVIMVTGCVSTTVSAERLVGKRLELKLDKAGFGLTDFCNLSPGVQHDVFWLYLPINPGRYSAKQIYLTQVRSGTYLPPRDNFGIPNVGGFVELLENSVDIQLTVPKKFQGETPVEFRKLHTTVSTILGARSRLTNIERR